MLSSAIAAAVGFPLINLLGPVLTLGVSLVFFFFAYRWVLAFSLPKWMRIVVMVLGALAVLGALGNLFNIVRMQLDQPDVPEAGVVSDEGELSDSALR